MFIVYKRPKKSGKWIPSASVFDQVQDILISRTQSEEALRGALTRSAWNARAQCGAVGVDLRQLPARPPTKGDSPDGQVVFGGAAVSILPQFWSSHRSLVLERMWDWERGIFAHVYLSDLCGYKFEGHDDWFMKIPRRSTAFGVEFAEEDVSRFTAELEAHVRRKPVRDSSRPRNKRWQWAPVLMQLEADIQSGAISRFGSADSRGAQAQIEKFIREWLSNQEGEEPSKSAVLEKAQNIMRLWRTKVGSPMS